MYDVFYNILQTSHKDLKFPHMDADSFVLGFSEGNVDNEHMDLSNLDPPIKTNNKVPVKFKHELGSRIIKEFISLSPKTYSFKDYPNKTKEKGIRNCNKAEHEECYYALIYVKKGCTRIQNTKIYDNMTTTQTSKISLSTFDDKNFM